MKSKADARHPIQRFGSSIILYPTGIKWIKAKGSAVFLKWEKIDRVRQAVGGSAITLSDASGKNKIKLLSTMPGFDEIQQRVFQEWGSRKPLPTLPHTFRAFPFRALTVSKEGLKIQQGFRTTMLRWNQIYKIQWGFSYLLAHFIRKPFIHISTASGQGFKLSGWWGQLPEIFATLRKLQDGYFPEEFEEPVHFSEQKLSKNLGWALWAGALWSAIPGFFFGKIFPLVLAIHWKPWIISILLFPSLLTLSYIFLLFFLWRAFRRESVIFRVRAPREEVHSLAAAGLIVFSLIAGFLFTNLILGQLGQSRLAQVKQEVVKAGYHFEMPANAPRLPDKDNAVYYLKKASEIPSAKALVSYNNPEAKKPFYGKKTQEDCLIQISKDLTEGKWDVLDNGLALRLLVAHQESIQLLQTAFEKQKVDWGINFNVEPGYKIESPDIPGFLDWSRLLVCKAYLQARQGNAKGALLSLRTALFLGDAAGQAHFLLYEMTRDAIYRIVLSRSPDVLALLNPELLEKAFLPFLENDILLNSFPESIQIEFFGKSHWMESARWGEGPFRAFDNSVYYEGRLEQLQVLKLPYVQQQKAFFQADADFKRNQWLIGSLESTMDLFWHQSKMLETVAWCRLAEASVESRIYHGKTKHWPDKISDLPAVGNDSYLDPFADGGALQITPQGKGIQISSLGPETHPDQGEAGGRTRLDWVVEK